MRRRLPWLAAIGISVISLVIGLRHGAQPAHAITNCDTSSAGMDATETQVLSLINAERQAAGVPTLLPSPGLSRAAAWKSEDAQSAQSHTDSLGRTPGARAADCGYPASSAGEIIAWGYTSPSSVMDAWMSSAGHRSNILTSYYTVAGVGYASGQWTVNFGLVNDSGAQAELPPPRPTSTPMPTRTPVPYVPPTATPTSPPEPVATVAVPPKRTPEQVEAQAVLDLRPGLNLITYAGAGKSVWAAFGPLGDAVVDVHRWDASANAWETWAPGEPSAFMMSPGQPYFIRMARPATLAD